MAHSSLHVNYLFYSFNNNGTPSENQVSSNLTREKTTNCLWLYSRSRTLCLLTVFVSFQDRKKGKISAQPHTTLCIQFLDRENNDKNNTFPLGKQICFTIVWGCTETLPKKKRFSFVTY